MHELSYRISQVNDKANQFDKILSSEQKGMIFFGSIRNFLLYFDKLNDYQERERIIELIEFYFSQIEQNQFAYQISEKKEISDNIIKPIAFYYIRDLDFKYHGGLKIYLFIALHIDLILLLTGVLKKLHYVPVASLVFFVYWAYIKIFYARKNKVY